MLLHPYLLFKGDARAAITFYQKALNLEIGHHQTYGDSPAKATPEQNDWLMHGELLHNGSCFAMLADSPTATKENNSAIHLSLNFENEKKAHNAFDNLSDGGKITLPFEKQFWNARFGQLTDRFGIQWMINCDLKQ